MARQSGGRGIDRVTFDANGNLFGMAAGGGATDQGTVWEVVPEPLSLVLSFLALALMPLVLRLLFKGAKEDVAILRRCRGSLGKRRAHA